MSESAKISRRSLLNSALLLAAAQTEPSFASALGAGSVPQKTANATAGAASRQRDPRPNIVFVIVDDLRFDGLSSTGNPFSKTPNTDRVAREGVTFRNFFGTTPLCSPGRASFLTGLYAHTHKIVNNDNWGEAELSHRLPTFPRLLYNAGYESAFIGKWHMGFDDTLRPGFDHWISYRAVGLYENLVFNVNGQRVQKRGYTTDFLNEYAVQFIEQPHDRPFVLYLSHKAPHFPYLPAARHSGLYADVQWTPPPVPPGDVEGKPAMRSPEPRVDVLHAQGATPEPSESRRGRPNSQADRVIDQARTMAAVDEGMGMLFAALERTGQLDNTMLIFTSDNGYLMGEHGVFDDKRWAYEPSIRLPLLMRYPRLIPAGSHRDQLTLNIDIAPTLMELTGTHHFCEMQGLSLMPVLRNENAPLRDSFLCEYFRERYGFGVHDWRCVRNQRWKYIDYPDLTGMNELYDLESDPHEYKNLIGDAAHREKVVELQKDLQHLYDSSQWTLRME